MSKFFIVFSDIEIFFLFQACTTFTTWFLAKRKNMDEVFYVDKKTGKIIRRKDSKMTKNIATIEIGFALTTCNFSLINKILLQF